VLRTLLEELACGPQVCHAERCPQPADCAGTWARVHGRVALGLGPNEVLRDWNTERVEFAKGLPKLTGPAAELWKGCHPPCCG
jgi:hypothetical protein